MNLFYLIDIPFSILNHLEQINIQTMHYFSERKNLNTIIYIEIHNTISKTLCREARMKSNIEFMFLFYDSYCLHSMMRINKSMLFLLMSRFPKIFNLGIFPLPLFNEVSKVVKKLIRHLIYKEIRKIKH